MVLSRLDHESLTATFGEDWSNVHLIVADALYVVAMNKKGLLVDLDAFKTALPVAKEDLFALLDVVIHEPEVVRLALLVLVNVVLWAPLVVLYEVVEHTFVVESVFRALLALQIVEESEHRPRLPVCKLTTDHWIITIRWLRVRNRLDFLLSTTWRIWLWRHIRLWLCWYECLVHLDVI